MCTMQSKKLIIGNKYRPLLEAFLTDFEIIWLPDNPFLDKRLSGHADLSVFNIKNNVIFVSDYYSDIEFGKETRYLSTNQGPEYPNDVKFNICQVGNTFILNETYVAENIVQYLQKAGEYSLINVKQGYARCSALAINNSIITSDASIYKACINNNINVLKISQGFFNLEGFDYGFIGGTAFQIDNNLYFTGSIEKHPDYQRIYDFCTNENVNISYLTDLKAFDIGGIILID